MKPGSSRRPLKHPHKKGRRPVATGAPLQIEGKIVDAGSASSLVADPRATRGEGERGRRGQCVEDDAARPNQPQRA
eukprot:8013073-Pyramimonas_sp.AAC.1